MPTCPFCNEKINKLTNWKRFEKKFYVLIDPKDSEKIMTSSLIDEIEYTDENWIGTFNCPNCDSVLFIDEIRAMRFLRGNLIQCPECEIFSMGIVEVRDDGCRYFECTKCGLGIAEETEEWFKKYAKRIN